MENDKDVALLGTAARADSERPPSTPRNLPDDVLLQFWQSVQGPKARLNGPLIRFAGLVFRESQVRTLMSAAYALDSEGYAEFDYQDGPGEYASWLRERTDVDGGKDKSSEPVQPSND